VLWLTYEMSGVSQYDRLVAIESRIATNKLINVREMDEWEKSKAYEARERISSWPIVWDDRRVVWWTDVVSAIAAATRMANVKVVVIDLFDRLHDFRAERQNQLITEKLQDARAVAMRYGVHVLAVAQTNRGAAHGREGPRLHDIKGAGGWEEVGDLVFMLSRPDDDEENDDGDRERVVTVRVAKQRNGPVFSRKFNFVGKTVRFEPLTEGAPEMQNTSSENPWGDKPRRRVW